MSERPSLRPLGLPPFPIPVGVLSSSISPTLLTVERGGLGYEAYHSLVREVVTAVMEDDATKRRSLEHYLISDYAMSLLSQTISVSTWAFKPPLSLEDIPVNPGVAILAQKFLSVMGVLVEREGGALPTMVREWVVESCLRMGFGTGMIELQRFQSVVPLPPEPQVSPLSPISDFRPFRHGGFHKPMFLLRGPLSASISLSSRTFPDAQGTTRAIERPKISSVSIPISTLQTTIPASNLNFLSTLQLPPTPLPAARHQRSEESDFTACSPFSTPSPYDPLFDSPPPSCPSEQERWSTPSLTQSQEGDRATISPNVGSENTNEEGLALNESERPSVDENKTLEFTEDESSEGSAASSVRRMLEEDLSSSRMFNVITPDASTLLKMRRKTTVD
ncbi:hypothetical protein DACRYDRAFT_119386 [Dacryopinax primogenitus]|uniref:Uncharacterized protein n=1 Tax=Dacryopinax primogenitus (strain DJM 731) TaxID=1858805 RepID=M5FNN5_DACPD|nr:uncharacterized protein DACRYDRAFT_119386 [Dacryopinax primogenitus]EJT97730.1 hypothetical protein DACRYDRAFT_119386 [Dacryopinax primogenitus]